MEGNSIKAQSDTYVAVMSSVCMQPWYAKMGLQLLPVMGQAEQQQLPSGMAGITYETNSIPEKGERKHRGEPKDSKKQRKKEKKEKKEERRLQPKASRISKSDKSQKAAVLNALRREREAREAAERDKARLAVLQATKQIDGCNCYPHFRVFHLSRPSL